MRIKQIGMLVLKCSPPELKRITHLITKARSESNFKFWNNRSSDSVAMEEMIIKNNYFDFFNMEGFNVFISSHMNHCYSLRRHRKDRAYEIARNKDRYSGLVSPRQKFLAIKKRRMGIGILAVGKVIKTHGKHWSVMFAHLSLR